MSTATNNTTAKQLLAMRDDGNRYELIKGDLKMMSPAGGLHGWIAMNLGAMLSSHVRENNLGALFAAETGFLIASDPDTVRAPDVAFVCAERLKSIENLEDYIPFAPDVAVEVISPKDTFSEVESKAAMWLEAGAKMVLVVDPQNQNMRVYRNTSSIDVLQVSEELDASDIVPGWKLSVKDVFLTKPHD